MPAMLTSRLLHESALVRIADVHCSCPRGPAGAEEHSESVSVAIARSGVFVRHLGSRAIVADAGTASFFRPGVSYRVSHPCEGGDECTSMKFSPTVLREILAEIDPRAADRADSFPEIDSGPCTARAFLIQAMLVRALRDGDPQPLETDELSLRLARELVRAAYDAAGIPTPRAYHTSQRAHRDLVERVKRHVAAHPGERFDLASLARAVHASPSHLSRVFRQVSGQTISGYVLRLRVRRALGEVLEGADLAGAAVRAGFYDQSHFTNACRREFGLPPGRLEALGRRGLEHLGNLVQETTPALS